MNTTDQLSHTIRPGLLEVAKYTSDAICELIVPTAQSKLRLAFGLCNVFSRVLPNFAHIASPLTVTLRKSQAKELEQLNEECLNDLRTLKENVSLYQYRLYSRKKNNKPATHMHAIAKFGLCCFNSKTTLSNNQRNIGERSGKTENVA